MMMRKYSPENSLYFQLGTRFQKAALNFMGTVRCEKVALKLKRITCLADSHRCMHLALYAWWVLASALVIFAFTKNFGTLNFERQEFPLRHLVARFVVVQLEVLGLVLVREKIKSRKSVSGISGMTLVMLQLENITCMACEIYWGNYDSVTFLTVVSIYLTFDMLKAVFVTHHDTYEIELDVLKAWYLVPAFIVLAILLHPQYPQPMESICMGFLYYMNASALMPQVMMMAMSGGNMQTPVANFVAATAISRCSDLFDSIFISGFLPGVTNSQALHYWMSGMLDEPSTEGMNSLMLILATEVVQFILLVDFLYYFFKARGRQGPLASKDEISLFDLAQAV